MAWKIETDTFCNQWYILQEKSQTDKLTEELLLELQTKAKDKTILLKVNDWKLEHKSLYHQKDDIYLFQSPLGDIIPRLLKGKIISARVIVAHNDKGVWTMYVVNDKFTPVLLPPGGTTNPDEYKPDTDFVISTAQREVKEESGLELPKEKLKKIGTLKFETNIMRLEKVDDVCHIFLAELDNEPIISLDKDNKEIISVDKMKIPIIPKEKDLFEFCKETLPTKNNKPMSLLWWYLVVGILNGVLIKNSEPDLSKKPFGPKTPIKIDIY